LKKKAELINHIVVPIKQVPETSNVKMDPETGTMIRKGLDSIINPLDLYAIEAALLLKEKWGSHITVLSMGPMNAEESLREALALGCDDAILLCDQAFRGSDTWATSYTISQGIRCLDKYDLIICGERATDGDTGQVGPGIAAFLGLPLITFVRRIIEDESGHWVFERLVEGGIETLETELPALITVVKEIANPRLPTLRGMKRAKEIDIPVLGFEELGVNPDWIGLTGSPTRVVKIQKPKVTRGGKIITAKSTDEIIEAADQLIGYLRENNLLN